MSRKQKWENYEPDESENWEVTRDRELERKWLKTIRSNVDYSREKHALYNKAIEIGGVIYCTGPAGTGKSYIACATALQMLADPDRKQFSKIIISRPNVGCGKGSGYLPGDRKEKNRPWMEPIEDNLLVALGVLDNPVAARERYKEWLKDGSIVFEDFEHMRGRNFRDAVVILDEAQNCTFHELKTILTRGYGATKFVVNGDLTQCDIKNSGLREAIRRSKKDPMVEWIHLTSNENMRSSLNKRLTEYFNRPIQTFHGIDVSFFSKGIFKGNVAGIETHKTLTSVTCCPTFAEGCRGE